MIVFSKPLASIFFAASFMATSIAFSQQVIIRRRPNQGPVVAEEVMILQKAAPAPVMAKVAVVKDVAKVDAPKLPDNPFAPGAVILVPPPPPDPNEKANLDAMIQQLTPQYRSMQAAEVHFIRAACGLDKDQRKLIDVEADKILKEVVTGMAEQQVRMQAGRGMIMRQVILGNNNPGAPADPRTTIKQGLARAVKEKLSAEQAARYEDEIAKRKANRKKVSVDNLVAAMDKDMLLTADQRVKIAESLAKNWNDNWIQSLQALLYGDNFFPSIPDAHVVPFLNPLQKKIWQAKSKQNQMFFGDFGMMQGLALEVEEQFAVEVDAKADAPKDEDAKKEVKK